MSSWPSKRKKSGRKHIFTGAGNVGEGDKSGTGKKISSGKIRAKNKRAKFKSIQEVIDHNLDLMDKGGPNIPLPESLKELAKDILSKI